MEEKIAGTGTGEHLALHVKQVPLDHIHADPEQPRHEVETCGPEWEGLVQSIRELGVVQPIVVRPMSEQPGHYVLVCGERRWRAAGAVGLTHITARVIKSPDLLERTREIQLLENVLREDLPPLDEMEACKELLARTGMQQQELAQRMGVTKSVVTDILKLDAIAPEVRERIRASQKRFSRRQLLRVAAKPSPGEQARAVDRLLGDTDDPGREDPELPGETVAPSSEATVTAREMEPAPAFRGRGYEVILDVADYPPPTPEGRIDLCLEVHGWAQPERVVQVLREVAERMEYEINVQTMFRRLGVPGPALPRWVLDGEAVWN